MDHLGREHQLVEAAAASWLEQPVAPEELIALARVGQGDGGAPYGLLAPDTREGDRIEVGLMGACFTRRRARVCFAILSD